MFPAETKFLQKLEQNGDERAWQAKARLIDRTILEMKRRDYQTVEEYDFYMRKVKRIHARTCTRAYLI